MEAKILFFGLKNEAKKIATDSPAFFRFGKPLQPLEG